jgi:hypothetical protein
MNLSTMTAAVLAASLSTAALAQTADVGAGVAAGAQGAGSTAAAGASADAKMNVGQIVSDLQNGTAMSSEWATQVGALPTGAEVKIVTLTELKGQGAENDAALDKALSDVSTDVVAARTAIEANTEVKAALEAQDFTAEDVVAITVDGEQNVTLIVDDAS